MNTQKVYFGQIYRVTSVDKCSYLGTEICLNYVKDTLMLVKKNIFGIKYMKDLNSGENYKIKLSTKIGSLYVSRSSLELFNEATQNKHINLPKGKVIELGNQYLLKKVKEK